MRLAPNPAATEVSISVEGFGETGGELMVVDAAGRPVWRQAVGMDAASGSLTLSLLDFPAGAYFVTLRADGQMMTKRLMVAR